MCAIARNERDYLLEWVAYHRLAGFDGIHVYDNVSDDGTSELLAALDAAGVVHRTHWPRKEGIPPQRHAYQHFLENHAGRYDWVLVCDLDEFVVPRTGTVKDFIRRGTERDPAVTAYALPWLVFGSGGQEEKTPGLVIERFTNCAERPGPSVKTLFRSDAVLAMRTHIADLMWGRYADNRHQRPQWSDRMPIDLVDAEDGEVLVHHYFTKSRAEWVERRKLPKADRATVSHRHLAMYDRYERLPREETRAAVMADRVRAEVRQLEEVVRRLPGRRLDPVVLTVSRDGVIGTVDGLEPGQDCAVRVVIDDVVERVVGCDRVVDGRPAFFVVGKWNEVPTKRVRVSVVGGRRAVKAVSDARRDPREVLETVQRALPGAEEKILTLGLELARTEEGADQLAKTLSATFEKFPWYGALLEGLTALHRGDSRGRDVLVDAAGRWPEGMRQLAEKLTEKDVQYALGLLDRHGLCTTTLAGPPTTA
ncbi:glycosyltransferase family 2 protein [Geodermatophilus pulveris]|uniref:glycosyltransferase family 2 protein n=1 Tax=Geodermatophilus pulveris TaxID=1564159 RepID=UPI0015C6816A|nr:glycosyltransferase family 2 protein [Geodermatophilus pulveris]